MTTYKSNIILGTTPMPTGAESDVLEARAELDLSVAGVALAANDVFEALILPAGHQVVDVTIDSDKLDTNGTPTIALDVGILDSAGTAIDTGNSSGGGKWLAASNVAQAGGIAQPSTVYYKRVEPQDDTDRTVAVVVSTGPATGATTGKLGVSIKYRPSFYGD